jgi:hypothetical protein
MKPTRTQINSVTEDVREEHPAYAMVGASRVTGNARLAGSDFRHQNYIVVTLRGAHLSRSLSNDRWSGNKSIVQFAMSEAQWATFVSAMNIGDGVPCTLEYTREDGRLPKIEAIDDRVKVFKNEMMDTMGDAIKVLQKLHDEAPTKKMKGAVALAIQEIRSNVPFVVGQFDEHMEKTVEKAKVEVNAYLTSAVHRAGIAALGGSDAPVIQLEAHQPDNEPTPEP